MKALEAVYSCHSITSWPFVIRVFYFSPFVISLLRRNGKWKQWHTGIADCTVKTAPYSLPQPITTIIWGKKPQMSGQSFTASLSRMIWSRKICIVEAAGRRVVFLQGVWTVRSEHAAEVSNLSPVRVVMYMKHVVYWTAFFLTIINTQRTTLIEYEGACKLHRDRSRPILSPDVSMFDRFFSYYNPPYRTSSTVCYSKIEYSCSIVI